jgi:hypothetical protein
VKVKNAAEKAAKEAIVAAVLETVDAAQPDDTEDNR